MLPLTERVSRTWERAQHWNRRADRTVFFFFVELICETNDMKYCGYYVMTTN